MQHSAIWFTDDNISWNIGKVCKGKLQWVFQQQTLTLQLWLAHFRINQTSEVHLHCQVLTAKLIEYLILLSEIRLIDLQYLDLTSLISHQFSSLKTHLACSIMIHYLILSFPRLFLNNHHFMYLNHCLALIIDQFVSLFCLAIPYRPSKYPLFHFPSPD